MEFLPGKLSMQSTVKVAGELLSCDLLQEAAILDLRAGIYYGLNQGGAWIWSKLQEPITIQKLLDTILEEYEVDRQRCQEDLLRFLKELAARDLLEVDWHENQSVSAPMP